MNLEFDNKDKKKWQCFVCGKEFLSYEEYNTHILSEHEEGREFVKCPSCEAAVRDLRLHYKVKHPNRTLPLNIQLKSTIWYDFSSKGKRKTKKPKFKEGYFRSEKNRKDIHYRSGMELEVYKCLENLDDVLSYEEEPFKVPYYYINETTKAGEWKEYIPDLRVNFIGGRTEIWEIKPAKQTSLPKNEYKWTAMNEYAKNLNWSFTVITEVGLNKLKMKAKNS